MIKEFFNKILNSAEVAAFILLVVFGMIMYTSNKNNKKKASEAEDRLESQISSFEALKKKCDSISSIPPDTFYMPSKIVKGEVVEKIFDVKDSIDEEYFTYKDSIKNDSIDLSVEIIAKDLFKVKYNYRPIYKYQEVIIEKPTPKIIEIPSEPIKVVQRGLFFNVGLGYGNTESTPSLSMEEMAFKSGLMLLNRKGNTYSIDYVRYSGSNIYLASYGIKF
jgi:hypothetical protein